MRYLIFDFETSIQKGHTRSSPHDSRNDIYVRIFKESGRDPIIEKSLEGFNRKVKLALADYDIMVGHNIKFDCAYIHDDENFKEFVRKGGKFWDTMLAAYLLSGQQEQMVSLKELSEKLLGKSYKKDRISQCFKKGIGTEKILGHPRAKRLQALLHEYCEGDAISTEQIFKKQWEEAKKIGMTRLILTYSKYILSQIEEERNGVFIDVLKVEYAQREYSLQSLELLKQITEIGLKYWPKNVAFNFNSTVQLSALLFGGEITTKVREVVGEYKNGKEKSKLVVKKSEVSGIGLPRSFGQKSNKKEGVYKVGADVLRKMLTVKFDIPERAAADLQEMCKLDLERRKLNKIISTYLKNMVRLHHKGVIHQNYNNCRTATGRLSSSGGLNVQNQAKAIKQFFISRFGDQGTLVEMDWKQLEIVVLVWYAQENVLIAELAGEGFDMHLESAAFAYGVPKEQITPEQRKRAKAMTFGLTYGQHYKNMATRFELPEEECKQFVDSFYLRYPAIKKYHENLLTRAGASAILINERLPIDVYEGDKKETLFFPGEFRHMATLRNPAGHKFVFKNKARLDKRGNINPYWYQPDLKDHPIQAFAGAIQAISQIRLLELIREYQWDNILMSNEVHDSRILDCRKSVELESQLKIIKTELEKVDSLCKRFYNCSFNVPIKIDVTSGSNWGEMKELTL